METYKVRINAKMVEDWRERCLDDEGYPATAGFHEFTFDEVQSWIKSLKLDIYYYADNEMPDMVAAAKRQLANFEKAVS